MKKNSNFQLKNQTKQVKFSLLETNLKPKHSNLTKLTNLKKITIKKIKKPLKSIHFKTIY